MGGSASVSRTTKEVSCDEVMKDNLVSGNPEAESRACILTPTLPQVRVIHYTGCRHGHKVVRASQSHKPVRAPQTMKPVRPSQSQKPDCASAEPWNLCESKITVQKYWIDENSGCNCFMLFPRNLAIIWAENKQYWNWPSMKFGEMAIEVAELVNVCWLEVNGKFDTTKLSPGVKYEILFVVMLKPSACGWGTPVNLRLVHPCGKTQHRRENLQLKPKSQWIELQVGEFQTSPQLSDCKKKFNSLCLNARMGIGKVGLSSKESSFDLRNAKRYVDYTCNQSMACSTISNNIFTCEEILYLKTAGNGIIMYDVKCFRAYYVSSVIYEELSNQ